MEHSLPYLLQPLSIRDCRLRNRIAVSPMCQYQAPDGLASDWHMVHLGRFALGGAGLVFTEAAAIEQRGRITHGDLGLWSPAHGRALTKVAAFIKSCNAVPGIQLAHAGRKASMQRPWFGNGPLGADDLARGDKPWEIVAPSAIPAGDGWLMPHELELSELVGLTEAWLLAAKRAVAAGFEAIEIHSAHGYLLHQFLSPLSNRRNDAYGGDIQGRMRFPLEVAAAVREALPPGFPLMIRISTVDWVEGGWGLADSIVYAQRLKEIGIDLIDCSSGGMTGSATASPELREPGYQTPFAAAIKAETGIRTMAVGLILDGQQADAIVASGQADLVAIGREFLRDPNWGVNAANQLLGQDGYQYWPQNSGWWLQRRRFMA